MEFHTENPIAKGLSALLQKMEKAIELDTPVKLFLAGGMAVNLYTAGRVTTDVDAEFDRKILLPKDIVVEIELEDGTIQPVYFDTNYNSNFALMHEDYQTDALPVELGLKFLQLRVLSPVDLVVSKLARFATHDQEDICELIRLGLVGAAGIEERASQALAGCIGNKSMLLLNLQEVLQFARETELNHPQG